MHPMIGTSMRAIRLQNGESDTFMNGRTGDCVGFWLPDAADASTARERGSEVKKIKEGVR